MPNPLYRVVSKVVLLLLCIGSFLPNTGAQSLPNRPGNKPILRDTLPLQGVPAPLAMSGRQSAKASPGRSMAAACNTTTFKLRIPVAAGEKIQVAKLQTFPDGNFLAAGTVTLTNSAKEGLLMVLANDGALLLQKRLQIDNKPVTITDARIDLGGDLYIAGLFTDGTSSAFFARLKKDLSVLYTKTWDQPELPRKITLDLYETAFMAIAVQLSSTIQYSSWKTDGTRLWNKQLTPLSLTNMVGLGWLSYGKLGLITNCQHNGKPMVQVSEIDANNGNLLATAVKGTGNDETRCLAISSFNTRLSIFGIGMNASATYEGFRDIVGTAATSETVHRYQLPVTLDPSVSAAMDNAGDALGYLQPASGQLVFIKHFAYYTTTPEFCRQYAVPGASSLTSIARSFDGGFLFGLNTTLGGEVLLIKTDSIGTLPTCGYQTIPVTSIEAVTVPNTHLTASVSTPSFTGGNSTVTANTPAYNTLYDCQQNYCPVDPLEDACLNTYYKTYRTSSYLDYIWSHYLMGNDNQFIANVRYDRILGGINQLTYGLKLLDEKGRLQKAVTVFNDTATQPFVTYQVDEHRVMLVSNVSSNGQQRYNFTLVDDNLQKIWSKTLNLQGGFYSGGSGIADIHKDAEGNFYILGTDDGFFTTPKIAVIKMDPAGNIIWTKTVELKTSLFLLTASITSTPTSLIIVAEASNGISLQLDKVTGQVLNSYLFVRNTDNGLYNRLLTYDNGRIFYAGSSQNSQLLVGLFDTTAKPLQLKYLNADASVMRAATERDGFMYALYNYYIPGVGFKEGMVKLDTLLRTVFINQYDMNQNRLPRGMSVSDLGFIYTGGSFSYGGGNASYADPYLIKYNQLGETGTCLSTPVANPFTDIPLNLQTLAYTATSPTYTYASYNVNLYPDPVAFNLGAILCSSIPQCSFIKVKDPGSICRLNTDYTIPFTKDVNCTTIPKWTYDTSMAVYQSATSTSVTFRFKKTGSMWLRAILGNGCEEFKDSILLSIQNSPLSLYLGKDTLFCPGDSVVLKADPGYNQYTWQDGSSGSSFIAKQTGKYYVEIANTCGEKFADTVNIVQGIVPPLSLGLDVQACIKDSVTLQASPGFAKYSWQPIAWIAGQTAQAKIAPPRDTTVIVQGITSDGCPARDTLLISLKAARPIYLGKDTSFCQSDSVTLQAGAGYQQYQWSTGSLASTLTVHQAGTYYVQAKDVNGCFARDTLTVVNTFATPVVSLGANRDLCTGDKLLLDAGNFNTYQWQDGSLNRTYAVSGTGSYWVTVTDNNHCTGKDTIGILKINPLPTGFLKSVDSLCRYGKLTIVPTATYRTYDWSTGTTSPTAIVTKPGTYTLAVTDNNGCIGKDTIKIVQKDCLFGFFIPNSFSPNGDYRNDVFRALLYGPVLKFKLQVYNRYGELIFGSTNPDQAWDGTWKGKPCDNGNYVWQCSYQLEGGEPVYKKGNVILVH
jgi:gliding motility-associated-like protein